MSARDFASLTHADHGTPLRWWHYTDSFAVAGFRGRDGRKRIAMAVRTGAQCYWHEPLAPLPLYGAADLQARPQAPVLVVQNEAIADNARPLFADHVCIAWAGGCGAVDKADIVPLRGRDVVAWPDDAAGATAMARLQVRLRGWAHHVALIAAPRAWPAPWHGDDPSPLPEAAVETLRRQLREALPGVAMKAQGDQHRPHPEEAAQQPALSLSKEPSRRVAKRTRAATTIGTTGGVCSPPFETPAAPAPQDEVVGCHKREEEDVRRTIEEPPRATRTGWPVPDRSLLGEGRGELPGFPVETLPRFWRLWAEHAACGAGATVDHVALSLLTTASGLIGGARRIAPAPSWSEPCVLWTALVGPPSSGKTPAQQAALGLLRELEEALATAQAQAHRRRTAEIEEAHQRWQAALRTATRQGGAMPPHPGTRVPAPPPRRRLLVTDPRVAALAEALPASSSGVLLSCDDGDAWLDGLRDDARRNGNLPFWRSAWSATPCAVNRKAASPVALAQPAVSILGTLRADAIVPALARCDDGAVAQLLFAWPDRPGFRALTGAPAVARADALRALARLRDMPGVVRDVALAPEAVAAFDRFRRAHHAQAGERQGLAAAWWGKGTGIVLRLAGVLAFLDWAARLPRTAEPAHVPAWAIEAAADLWQGYLWPHAQAVLRTGGNTDQRRAGQVLRWLARQGADEVSGTALRVAALGRACNAAQTARITQSLARAGWLRPVVADARHAGRPPARWAVHPDLRDGRDA